MRSPYSLPGTPTAEGFSWPLVAAGEHYVGTVTVSAPVSLSTDAYIAPTYASVWGIYAGGSLLTTMRVGQAGGPVYAPPGTMLTAAPMAQGVWPLAVYTATFTGVLDSCAPTNVPIPTPALPPVVIGTCFSAYQVFDGDASAPLTAMFSVLSLPQPYPMCITAFSFAVTGPGGITGNTSGSVSIAFANIGPVYQQWAVIVGSSASLDFPDGFLNSGSLKGLPLVPPTITVDMVVAASVAFSYAI